MQESLGNGGFTARVVSPAERQVVGIQTYGALASDTIQDLAYSYDSVGNLESRSDNIQGLYESFGYDDLNRLTSVSGPESKTYAYDSIGNITFKSDVGDYTYSQDGVRPHAVLATSGVRNNNYTYDANGNMTSGAGRTLVYTSFNKPSQITAADGTVTNLAYSPDHNRIIKTVDAKTVTYVSKIFERTTSSSGTEYQQYIMVSGKAIAIRKVKDGALLHDLYLHRDHLGSVDVITDETGAIVERLSFDAFGAKRLPTNWMSGSITPTLDNLRIGYTGHESDDESGLINMGARMYDPILGRFLSPDSTVAYPYSTQGFNRYSYTDNNPLSRIDPTGYRNYSGINRNSWAYGPWS